MSIVYCNEIKENRTASIDDRARRHFTRSFRVKTDDHSNDGGYVLANASGLPAMFVPYTTDDFSDPYSYVNNREARQVDQWASGGIWECTITYATPEFPDLTPYDPSTGTMNGSNNDPNPVNRSPTWTLTYTRYEEAVQRDLNGRQLVNSAGQAFLPPITRVRAYPTWKVVKNYVGYSFQGANTLFQTVNNATWNGAAAGQVLLDDIGFESQFENGFSYLKVSYTFLINYDGWQWSILDQGYAERRGSASGSSGCNSGNLYQILDARGQPLTHPSLLDGMGRKLACDGTPIYLPFKKYNTADFSVLP